MAVLSYTCRNCGSALRFNAGAQDWTCEFCGSVFVEADLTATEPPTAVEDGAPQGQPGVPEAGVAGAAGETAGEAVLDEKTFNAQIRSYSCPGCGAEIITDQNTAATFCLYCHNPAILPHQLSGVNKPAKVIPFAYPRKEVVDIFLKWCKKKPLLPNSFTSRHTVDKLTGIYIPYWLFDCSVSGKMRASARTIRSWVSGNTRYTETKTYDVYREITADFKGVPADGSKRADDQLMETIEPYDFKGIRPFAMPYLAGYQAEKYDVDSEAAFTRVKERVKQYTENLIRNTIKGYSSVTVSSSEVLFNNSRVEYALLPVWLLTFHYEGKSYFFAMNGQTGKVAGKLPVCRGKVVRYFAAITAALYLVMLLGGMLL